LATSARTRASALLVGMMTSLQLHAARSDALGVLKEEQTQAMMTALRSDLRRAMQQLGYNAIILPKEQSLGDWYAEDYAAYTMPLSWAARLDDTQELADRYVPRLRQRLKWEERQWMILVIGVGRERVLDTSVCEGVPLADVIPRGSCVVGYELHHALGLKAGDPITILGRVFQITRCEQALGTKDDISIWLDLADAQELLDKPDAINEILIVEHLAVWGDIAAIRRRLATVLPECQVVEVASETMSRAHARIKVADEARASGEQERDRQALLLAERRSTMRKLMPLGVLACAVWIGFLMVFNVRERAAEIAVLRAIGFRAGDVRALVLSKACLLGLAGGLAGFALGVAAAILLEDHAAGGAGLQLGLALEYLGFAAALGVAACLLGSWLPAAAAAGMDPAEILQQE
jgi:putative ABC transport system permease protein